MPTRTDGARCRLVVSGTTVLLIPDNNDAKVALDAFFAAHGSKTTVAITNPDASMGGYGDTSAPYKSVQFVVS